MNSRSALLLRLCRPTFESTLAGLLASLIALHEFSVSTIIAPLSAYFRIDTSWPVRPAHGRHSSASASCLSWPKNACFMLSPLADRTIFHMRHTMGSHSHPDPAISHSFLSESDSRVLHDSIWLLFVCIPQCTRTLRQVRPLTCHQLYLELVRRPLCRAGFPALSHRQNSVSAFSPTDLAIFLHAMAALHECSAFRSGPLYRRRRPFDYCY